MITRILVLLLLIGISSFAQDNIEVQEPTYIKSVQLRPAKANAYLPIVKLGERLFLHFYDLE